MCQIFAVRANFELVAVRRIKMGRVPKAEKLALNKPAFEIYFTL